MSLVILGVLLLLTERRALHVAAEGTSSVWPLTSDGHSRFAGWLPDGRTVLINRWGAVVGDGPTRQLLSELWAMDVEGGSATWLRDNAVEPAYSVDGQRLAYLSFVGDGRWEVRVLDLSTGQEKTRATADWHMAPAWVGTTVAFLQNAQVRLSSAGTTATSAPFPTLLAATRVRVTADGMRVAWSDGMCLWAAPHPGGPRRVLVTDAQVLDFAWSPNGRRLAYVTVAGTLSPQLWVASVADGTEPVLLAQGEAETFSSPTWSPDGRTLALSRTPLGAETASASDIWVVSADGGELHPLLRNDLEESSPVWSPDGRYLAFSRGGDVWIVDMSRLPPTVSVPAAAGEDFSNLTSSVSGAHQPTVLQQMPPLSIRVLHRAENYYRQDVPAGQIDVIPLETYVKRVVPVEINASSFPLEAIKAQAMAARTYAWYYSNVHAAEDWDVSDWTDYQVLGREDHRHHRGDAATDDTRGQYIAYGGNVIKAFYSAENGCPTRGIAGVDYIQAVDDPVSFGQQRWGHGWGMSQRGAQRWADWYGWGYQQILTHYYSGATVALPGNGGPLPIGGVTLPWSDFAVRSNRVNIVANASDEAGAVSAVRFYATLAGSTTLLATDTEGSDQWTTVWDVAALGDTTVNDIVLSAVVLDSEGHTPSQAETVHLGLDRQPPTNVTVTIPEVDLDTITATLSSLSATDRSPGSGVQTMAFSNEHWAWEGEDLLHQVGEEVDDEDALNGKTWRGMTGTHGAGFWYGPYTYDLRPGHAYRAYFRLKTNDVLTSNEVAMLDVVDGAGTRLLGLRRLRGTDFRAADTYQEFPVDFNYTSVGSAGLEFRTAFRSTADLYLDRVLVVSYPVSVTHSVEWRLSPGEGPKIVTVKFIDGAGNVSADLTRTVTLSDTSPPTGWQDFAPEWGNGGSSPTWTVRVFDDISGLNVDSARYRFSTDGEASWGDWRAARCTGISGTTEIQTITASRVSFDQPWETGNHIEFCIANMKGYTSTVTYSVRSRIQYLPLVLQRQSPFSGR